MTAILATSKWATNADLIADCARLGYLRDDWLTLDPTYGVGTFWKKWRPQNLVASDLFHGKGDTLVADFTALPFADDTFDAVVYDPPYKLNGTPDEKVDNRYGVDLPKSWQGRLQLMVEGLHDCARVFRKTGRDKGFLLVKCQDQVSSAKVRWQSLLLIEAAAFNGFGLADRFDFLGGRAQPKDRRQVHAHRNSSQLLVFEHGLRWRP